MWQNRESISKQMEAIRRMGETCLFRDWNGGHHKFVVSVIGRIGILGLRGEVKRIQPLLEASLD
jgi:hypothetical protein